MYVNGSDGPNFLEMQHSRAFTRIHKVIYDLDLRSCQKNALYACCKLNLQRAWIVSILQFTFPPFFTCRFVKNSCESSAITGVCNIQNVFRGTWTLSKWEVSEEKLGLLVLRFGNNAWKIWVKHTLSDLKRAARNSRAILCRNCLLVLLNHVVWCWVVW